MDTGHQDDRTAARWDTRLPAKAVVAALLLIVGVSLFVHLRGLTHDLPAPGADEPYFVLPAARMAWKGDADPQWFGHPGSTVIYPLALAYPRARWCSTGHRCSVRRRRWRRVSAVLPRASTKSVESG